MNLPNFKVVSAGLEPKPVDVDTVSFMREKGMDISHHKSQSVEQVPNLDYYQIIIALSEASKKIFPKPPTKTVCLDWNVKDPSAMQGSSAEKKAALEETYQFIHANLQDLSEAVLGDEID
jgi:arsenate reductase